ncbi:hypothetical protein ISN44_As12g032250 [Arabidopsis suecica]|uniref:Uncharacterized protein n=1 Tax=Arabidopsis suecica TaxID=45249 RepID=A0A8T1YP39_ARASU|nr:hypothetical protein ISN44_As12g032250 [Arabidopsis suecica]
MPNCITRSSKEKNLVNLSILDLGKLERTNRKAQKSSTMVRGEIRADEEGILRDDDEQAYNEAGQGLDDQGIIIPEELIVDDLNIHNPAVPPNAVAAHVDGVARHHQGVARHQPPTDVQIRVGQQGQQQPPITAARQLTLGDYNRPDLFYAKRLAIVPPPFQRNDFELKTAYFTLSIKITFLNNFYDDGKSEELHNKLSTFTQMALDATSNGNFNTMYPIYAVALIENLACSNSTKNADFERQKIAGAITGTQFAEVNAKLDSVHSLLTGKKAVHFAAEVETIEPEEESEEGVLTFQKTYLQTSSFQRTYGNTTYQNPTAPTPESKMETMLEQILEGHTKLTVEFNGKFDAIYSDLNGKIDTLNTHMKKLDVQVAQTATAVRRQDGVLPGMPDANPKRTCNAILVRDGDDVWEELDTEDELELAAAEPMSSATRWCRSTPVRFPWKTTFDEDSSIDTTPLASTQTLSVDRHHQGVDRHQPFIEPVSTFDGELSTATVSPTSISSTSVDRHSSSVDRHWVRTAPYALVFPPTKPVYTPPVPFPKKRRSKQEIQDARCKAIMEKILTSIPKVNPATSSPTLDRYVRRLVNNGVCAEEAALLTKDISLISRMPEKLPDPGSFVLDCSISTGRFRKSLRDLGSSINLMPHSVAVCLGMTSYRPTHITLLLGDRSKRIPKGILEDVPVKIGDCLIPADFVVLDYDVEPKDPLILGRAFLATAGAKINVKKGQISLDVCDVKLNFDMKGPRTPPILSDKSFSVESTRESAQELQCTTPSEPDNAQLAIQPSADGLVSTDTTCVDRHPRRPEIPPSAHIARETANNAKSSGAVPESYRAPRPRFPRLDQQRYCSSPPHPLPSSLNTSISSKKASQVNEPRDSRVLVYSFVDAEKGTQDAVISTTFLGHEHTSTAYTPPWLARRHASEKSSNTSPAPPHS